MLNSGETYILTGATRQPTVSFPASCLQKIAEDHISSDSTEKKPTPQVLTYKHRAGYILDCAFFLVCGYKMLKVI